MTDPLTDAYLDAIEQRANAATEGPWFQDSDNPGLVWGEQRSDGDGYWSLFASETGHDADAEPQDAEFIAHARGDVPALLSEVLRLRAMEQRVREHARHLARPFADGVPDWEGEQIASELLAALDGGE